jgi:hypothetical protein
LQAGLSAPILDVIRHLAFAGFQQQEVQPMSIETIVIVVVIVLIVLFVLGYFGRGRMRG